MTPVVQSPETVALADAVVAVTEEMEAVETVAVTVLVVNES